MPLGLPFTHVTSLEDVQADLEVIGQDGLSNSHDAARFLSVGQVLPDSAWQTLALNSGFTAYTGSPTDGPPQYAIHPNGLVMCRGSLVCPPAGGSGTPWTAIPAGARPGTSGANFFAGAFGVSTPALFEIAANGVTTAAFPASAAWVSLRSIIYPIEA